MKGLSKINLVFVLVLTGISSGCVTVGLQETYEDVKQIVSSGIEAITPSTSENRIEPEVSLTNEEPSPIFSASNQVEYRQEANNLTPKTQENRMTAYSANKRGDYISAFKIYKNLAEEGDAESQYQLSNMYDQGRGIGKNSAEMTRWLQNSAKQGYAEAQVKLGWLYNNGSNVPKDQKIAVSWYRKAAEQGNDKAQVFLAQNIASGSGVSQDYVEAFFWFSLSAEQGNKYALIRFNEAVNLLTTNQISELTERIKSWRQKKQQAEISSKEEAAIRVQQQTFPITPLKVNYIKGVSQPNDIAVIIGNANYMKQGQDIPNVTPAYADAVSFRRYVIEVLGVSEDNIIFLKDATQKDLVSTFGSEANYMGRLFRYIAEGKSRVFVFYSGHGAPDDEGTSFLVPTDAEASLINLNGYSLKTLYQNLSKLSAKSVTVVLEACFSGSSEAGTVITNASPINLNAKDTSIPSNITVIAAGAANQIASWEKDKSHGLFTKYFLKGMSGEADNDNDRKVSWVELKDYLAKTVTRSAMRNYGRVQTPQIIVGSGG